MTSAKCHLLDVQEPWFSALVSGRKTVEGRTGPDNKYAVGETLVLSCEGKQALFKISRVRHFVTLAHYCAAHDSLALTGIAELTPGQVERMYSQISADGAQVFAPERVEERGGICALTLVPMIVPALQHVPAPIDCPAGNVLFVSTDNPYLAAQYTMSRGKAGQASHAGDSGIDLYCAETFTIRCGQTLRIDLGIRCEMLRNGAPQSFYIHPRSSLSKTPLILANSAGVIDAGYRGNLLLALKYVPTDDDLCDIIWGERKQLHLGCPLDKSELPTYTVHAGQRLVQICSPDLAPIRLVLCKSLTKTSRGDAGFGSTGQ